jgi:hypothetical protein
MLFWAKGWGLVLGNELLAEVGNAQTIVKIWDQVRFSKLSNVLGNDLPSIVIVHSLRHLAELDVKVKAKDVGTFFLAGLDINRSHWRQVHLLKTIVRNINLAVQVRLQVRFRLGHLALSMLHNLVRVHLLSRYLCIVFQDALSLIRAFKVFASDALAILVAWNACLKAFTVLFEALAFFAVTALCMPLLPVFTQVFCRD